VAIGWLRPVVLLPMSAITGLNPDQLRAVLAHDWRTFAGMISW